MTRCVALVTAVALLGCGATLSGPTSGESIEVKDAIFAVRSETRSDGHLSYLYVAAGNHPDLCAYYAGSSGAQKANLKTVLFFGFRMGASSAAVPQWSAGKFSLGEFVQGPPESPTLVEAYGSHYGTTNASCETSSVMATSGTINIEQLSADSLTAELDFFLPAGQAVSGRVKARRCAALEGNPPGTPSGICER